MHLQLQSPLFSTIPPEIRNRIFWLALQEYEDPAELYKYDTYYTRPGSLGRKRVDTELLRTCKLVYTETKTVPFQDLELQVYMGVSERAPPHMISTSHHIARTYGNLSAHQWSLIKHIRFFVQLHKFTSEPFGDFFSRPPVYATRSSITVGVKAPETITIVVRYTDWWYWEVNEPLDLTTSVWKDIKFPASVKKVVMELETADVGTRRRQLDTIVHDLFARPDSCMYGREDGKMLRINGEKGASEWTWQGSTTFGSGGQYAHHPDGDVMRYVVKVLVWDVVHSVDEL